MAEGRVEDIYEQIKSMVVGFSIPPEQRINEVGLARQLDVSRTPLREALNRLVSERLIDFRPGTGFFCRPLQVQNIYDLYELRQIIEVATVRMACARGSDADIAALKAALKAHGMDTQGKTVSEACALDEAFHISIAQLTGNASLVSQLIRINEQLRFIRWVDMSARVKTTKGEHRKIMRALIRRDADKAEQVMTTHISRRMDQVVDAVKEGISNIYMGGAAELATRMIEDA